MFVFDEIEMMTMHVDFGRASVKAMTEELSMLSVEHKRIVDDGVYDWEFQSTACVIFLKMAFDLQEPSVVRFTGLHMIQTEEYAVFAFAENAQQYYEGNSVWLIYYHVNQGCMFMCYQPSRGGRGSYW